MQFQVVDRRPASSDSPRAYLVADNWDDWFKYSTLYHLHVVDATGEWHSIGMVKIGEFDMSADQRTPRIPSSFTDLGEAFFSLGQDDAYYSALNNLPGTLRDTVLAALRDVAADSELFERAWREDVTRTSLMRSVTRSTVCGQFRRMAFGGARLSRYSFTYHGAAPKAPDTAGVRLEFEVTPESRPPTNVHVVIGRNGVGKTYLLNSMQESLLEMKDAAKCGSFEVNSRGEGGFANLVSVSFSAFDEFELIPDRRGDSGHIGYAYVGLKRTTSRGADIGTPKSPEMLTREFVKSLRESLVGSRRTLWESAIETLQTDPVFKDADIASFARLDTDELEILAPRAFARLSSGHKIILLTTTRLVELVEEKTLVMLDEPEAHLHPPLLAAFVRALSDLLVHRNGVALIATHSPVVLQEVPRSCVSVLQRHGRQASAERPQVETFGENVGVLTREVFGLEVTHSGFHRLLDQAVSKQGDYESVLEEYDGQLGAEARAIVRALTVNRGVSE